MSASGGEPKRLPILPSANMSPVALSPDGSEMLVVDGEGIPRGGPLWSLPVLGGSPRRIGDVIAQSATLSPDGKMLAYGNGGDLFVAKADGTDSRRVAALQDGTTIFSPAWSPDGTRLRFDDSDSSHTSSTIWEVSADGTDLHSLLPGLHTPAAECCGLWTASGKYFVFASLDQIWALPRRSKFRRADSRPVQLTSSPLSLFSPVPSSDGRKLFVVGETVRGKLVRYDSKSAQFVPFLGGISAEWVAFSKDGQWVAYVSFPEGILWRSKVDGSERQQLTYGPTYALLPRWSPDGKTILYFGSRGDKPSRIYEVSPEGGSSRPLLPDVREAQQDPNWSPDGSKIVFAGTSFTTTSSVRNFDRATQEVSTLPGSQGFFSPRWSPDGRSVAAMTGDSSGIVVFDFQTKKWTELVRSSLGWLNWSKDGQSIIAMDQQGTGAVVRIHIRDRKVERLAELKNIAGAGRFGASLALAPDDSPLLLENAGTKDVYALDWEEP